MLLIDNYDSFTWNIVQYLRMAGVEPIVIKNDEISPKQLENLDFSSIIISPGPSNPDNAGISLHAIEKYYKTKKILGICLGMQCIAQFFGAKIVKDPNPFHGKTSKIFFKEKSPIFTGIPDGFNATRYHSLVVDKNTLKTPLKITANTDDDKIMAIEHEKFPVFGVQFHPEAILTEFGHEIIENFVLHA